MLTTIELWLLNKALSEVESPEAKSWVIAQLKTMDTATSNKYFKVMLEALEEFLAVAPAA